MDRSAPVATWSPPPPGAIGVSRRQFFNRSLVALVGVGLSGFGSAVLAFLWPRLGSGFGTTIVAGDLDTILATVRDTREPFFVPAGRFYVVPYPAASVGKAGDVYPEAVVRGMAHGVTALYQKCPHLGCRVPFCVPSQWFECPCHQSKFNRVGEKKAGPAPRGMDRFGVEIVDGAVVVDTSFVYEGPPIGVNTSGQEAEGPHCVSSGHRE